MQLLKDKVVVITGVGPGMGRKLATIAAEEGAKVAMCARNQGFLDEVAAEIKSAGGQAIAVAADMGDEAACHRVAAAATQAFGRIDGLVASAYMPANWMGFENSTTEAWIANMDITCFGALRMARAVLPAMKAAGGGAIVNITALANAQPIPNQAEYAVAKAALEGATRQLAKEFGPYKIRVNATRMGWLWGAPVKGFVQGEAKRLGVPEEQVIQPIAAKMALGVIPVEEDCARTALMFLSDYTKMVTGTVLNVNGGEYFNP